MDEAASDHNDDIANELRLPAGSTACQDEALGAPTSSSDREDAVARHPEDTAPATPHPQAQEILRQVEYYLSDENLPGDAHLLAKMGGDGNGIVSIKHILGFPKMRKFRPRSQAIASLRMSDKIEIVDDKYIRRREPLAVPLRVKPQINMGIFGDSAALAPQVPKDKPWLTKGMLRPTGFEENATLGPIKPEEYALERKLYDPSEAFYVRIETAVARFVAKRKRHQLTANILTKFLMFGGFDASQRQFNNLTKFKNTGEEYNEDELIQTSSAFAVAELVIDGLGGDEAETQAQVAWVVDFEGMARSFLSTQFMAEFSWYDEETVKIACNVLRNFYAYLLYHDVCPEYAEQIFAAQQVCKAAEFELLKLGEVDRALPGTFNIACSTLHRGTWSEIHRDTKSGQDWAAEGDNTGLSREDSFVIFATAIMAHGTTEQMAALEDAAASKIEFQTAWSEEIGLEVVEVELAPVGDDVRSVYEDDRLKNTTIRPTGRLHCILWEKKSGLPPHAALRDLSREDSANIRRRIGKRLVFLMEEGTLRLCYPGMRMEADIRELNIGIQWIDRVNKVYPSFHEWVENERVREYEKPGKPEAWMRRQLEAPEAAMVGNAPRLGTITIYCGDDLPFLE